MPVMNPQVSVVMPAYNAGREIEASIRSVLAQTWPSHELIVIDDASTDRTPAIVQSWVERDPRIVLLRNRENRGVSACRNRGLQNMRGRFLMFLDADDLWEETKVEAQLDFMRQHNCAVSYTDYCRFSDTEPRDVRKVHAPETLSMQDLLVSNDIGMLTSAIDLQRVPELPQFRKQGHEDYIFWLDVLKSIAPEPARKAPSPRPLAYYRERRSSLSSSILRSASWHWQVLAQQEVPLPERVILMARYCMRAAGKRHGVSFGQKKASTP